MSSINPSDILHFEFNKKTGQYRSVFHGWNDCLIYNNIKYKLAKYYEYDDEEEEYDYDDDYDASVMSDVSIITDVDDINHIESPAVNRYIRNYSYLENMRDQIHLQRRIKCYSILDKSIRVFKNKTQCAHLLGCSPALIYNICEGKTKTFKNEYTFIYTDDPITDIVGRKKKYTTPEQLKHAQYLYNKKYLNKIKLLNSS